MAVRRLLPIEEARAIVLAAAAARAPLPAERLPLATAALGRVLAHDVVASADVPGFDSSAMDGFAVRAQDVADATVQAPVALALAGESRAGVPTAHVLRAGEAVAISTGAVVPAGADAIVPLEDTRAGADGTVAVLSAAAGAGAHVRRAGEDMRAGATVMRAGTTLGAAALGVLAALGHTDLACVRRPRVAVLVSGDELLAPGEPMRPGGVRDSNSLSLAALVLQAGGEVTRTGAVGDDAAATRAAIAGALEGADALLVCGGVSVGVHDHVRPSLAALGARERFWGVALKPGRPAWFGTADEERLVFGLPGNPVSAIVTFLLLVAPALRALLGAPEPPPWRAGAVLDDGYAKPRGRAHALRVRLRAEDDGWHAQPLPAQGSHVLTSLVGADALALIATERERVHAGERVPIELLASGVGRGG